jgi:cytochrome c556
MQNRLNAVVALLVAVLACSAFPSRAQEKNSSDQEKEKASVWMKKKLEFSQNVLAGLTEADFEKIGANARAMNVLGYLEKWVRADRPGYKQQAAYFEFANQELIRQAREKNLDGATLAYNQLTVSCVQCHKIVRSAKE